METEKTVGEWIFADIENNTYLKKLYNKLIMQYTNKLQFLEFYLSEKEIRDLHRFADLLSKSTDSKRGDFQKNIAQNIVCILDKIYPDSEINKLFMGSVLSNVNNYVGLSGKCDSYKNPDIVEGLVEYIVKEAYRIPSECGTNMYFDASQGIAFENINNKEYYSFSAPTSMGKTFLVKMFIKAQILRKNKRNYVIVVPSKALINEVKSEIISAIGENLAIERYKVITTPTAVVKDEGYNYIMIYTQERLSYQIKIYPNVLIDYLFVDEAQKISEVSIRSTYFYKIINHMIMKNEVLRVYFLCPYIPNPEIYLNLIPSNKGRKHPYDVFEFSPVNQHKIIVDLANRSMEVYSDLTKEFLRDSIHIQSSSITEYIFNIGKDKSNIVFCDSKKSVEEQAIEYWKKCNIKDDLELKQLIEDIKKEIHPKSFLVYFLQRGICCHVGYLPSTIKAKIENLFKKKIIRTIFCTSTLLEGVNLPADNLFIIVKKKSYILKHSADFKNLMGRVGRKTYNLVGNVYIIPQEECLLETYERCKELVEKPVENQELSIDKLLDNKLKKKIINNLLQGNGTIAKGNMSYDMFGMTRFVINILIKSILEEDSQNYIYKKFSSILDSQKIITIRENFKDEPVSDDSCVTVDQLKDIDTAIQNNEIKYPDTVDYPHVKEFLEKLYDLFHWEKYESKKEIGKREKLSYYAVLVNQWMQGHSIRRIIDKSIEHHKKNGVIYNEGKKENYIGKGYQDNIIVVDCLTAIEDVLLFSISNYFTKFTERYKEIKKVEVLDYDWSEFLDFGTNDKLVIELQKIGFSREVAKLIEKGPYAAINENGILIFNNKIFHDANETLVNELSDVKLNYSELFKERV